VTSFAATLWRSGRDGNGANRRVLSVLADESRRRELRFAAMRRAGSSATIGLVRPTVLIVDDHEDFRASAGALLDAEGFTVVGGAADGATALTAAARLVPDVVLLDVQLPDLDGFAVAHRLAAMPDPPRVVLVSSRPVSDYGARIDDVDVSGFLAKDDLTGESLAALVC